MVLPATVPISLCGGQGWVHIVTSSWPWVWSLWDLQVKQHPRKAMEEQRGRSELDKDYGCHMPPFPLPVPRGAGTGRSLPQGQEKSPGSLSWAKGCPQNVRQCPPTTDPAFSTTLLPGQAGRSHRTCPKLCTSFAGVGKAPAQGLGGS